MAAIDFGSLASSLAGVLPNNEQIIQQVAVGAASGVVLAGLKAQVASGALDPLGLFPHQANAPAPTPANNPNATVGPTITASAFSSLTPAAQGAFLAAGGHIVAG